MRALILIFITIFSIGAHAKLPGFTLLDKNTAEYENYFEARKRAIKYIRMATPKLNAYAQEVGEKAIQQLLLADFYVSSTAESTARCDKNSAFVFVNAYVPNSIFVCNEVRSLMKTRNPPDIDTLAQLFVHESNHLVDLSADDECVATLFELAIMNNSIGIKSTSSRDSNLAKGTCSEKDFEFYSNIRSKTGFRAIDGNIASSKGRGTRNFLQSRTSR